MDTYKPVDMSATGRLPQLQEVRSCCSNGRVGGPRFVVKGLVLARISHKIMKKGNLKGYIHDSKY
jgi:hypothetical protein